MGNCTVHAGLVVLTYTTTDLNNGKYTCQHYAGSEGHLAEDVKTIGGWNVDGLKLDGCYMTMPTYNRVNDSYAEASAAIRETGRPMVFICSYPYYERFGGGMAGLPGGKEPDFRNANQICDTFRFMDDVNLPPASEQSGELRVCQGSIFLDFVGLSARTPRGCASCV